MGKRVQTPPTKCIFCDRTGMSKEHIWSDWLKELLPRRKMHRQGAEAFEFQRGAKRFAITRPMEYQSKRGCLTQRKVRKVCKQCNNGWMGQAVNDAKPIASELIQGRRRSCDENELRKLITWLSITVVMQEFIAPDSIYIPVSHRTILMNEGLPPTDWTIWIGFYDGVLASNWAYTQHDKT